MGDTNKKLKEKRLDRAEEELRNLRREMEAFYFHGRFK